MDNADIGGVRRHVGSTRAGNGPRHTARSRRGAAVVVGAALSAGAFGLPAAVAGADGTWTNATTGGLWSDANNWAGGVVADGQDGTADFSTLNITADNTVQLDSPRTIGNLTFGDATTASNNWTLSNNATAANVLTLSTSAGAPTITVTNQTATVSAVLAGTQGLAKAGNGTLVLTAANPNLTGPVTVTAGPTAAGSLRLTNAAAVSTTSGVTLNNTTVTGGTGTQLELQNNVTVNLPLTMNSSGTFRTALRTTSASTNTWSGPITVNGNAGALAQFYADGGGTLNVNGNITGGAGYAGTVLLRGGSTGNINGTVNIPGGVFSKTDSSTWTINSTGNAWGATQISVGTIKLGAANAIPVTTTLTMGQNDTNNATLDLNGRNQTIAGLVQSTTGGNKLLTNTVAATPSTLTINNAAAATFGGTTTGPATATIAGNLSLVKSGAGVLTLASANTYTGTTTVSAGTLRVNGNGRLGAAASTADVTVGDAGLLDLQVGGAIGDAAALRVTSTDATAEVGLADGVNETVASLVLNGLSFGGPGATYGSTASGAANPGLAAAGLNPDDFFSGTGVLTTAVPEPAGAAVAGGLAAAGLLARRHRRRA